MVNPALYLSEFSLKTSFCTEFKITLDELSDIAGYTDKFSRPAA